MTLELILWILAGIVIGEILFIFLYKDDWEIANGKWKVTKLKKRIAPWRESVNSLY